MKKERRKEKPRSFLQSQVGAMDKFLSNKSNVDKEVNREVRNREVNRGSLSDTI